MEEIRMYDDNPTMGLSFNFMEAFLKSSIGCWSITGNVSDIELITKKKLLDYRKRFLTPSRMVVVLAGNLGTDNDIKSYFDTLEDCFGSWKNSVSILPQSDINFDKETTKTVLKDIEQAHFCLGWQGVSWKSEKRYIAKMVETILMGNSSSILWNEIRENRGLAYYLFPISEHFENFGLMGLQAGVALQRLPEAIEVTRSYLSKAVSIIKESDLERAKDYFLGKLSLSMDQTDFWSDLVGQRMLLTGKVVGVEQLIAAYTKVTLTEVKNFIKDYIDPAVFRIMTLER